MLPDASFDAFDLAKERDAGPPCLFEKTPHTLGPVYAPIFGAFAVGRTLHWFGVENPMSDDRGAVGNWRAKIEGGTEKFNYERKDPVALWVDRNGVYTSQGYNVERPGLDARNFKVPTGYAVRAMVADDTTLFALLASSDCRMTCVSPLGHQLVATPLAPKEAEWSVLDSSVDRLPPSPWKGDLARDEKAVFFILRMPDGRAEIRRIEKAGGQPRPLVTTEPGDAGTTQCRPPAICIDGDLHVHRGNLYWLGAGSVFTAPADGGAAGVVVDAMPSRVTWFALDADFLYTSELSASGELAIVRRSLSATGTPKVVFSHQLVEPANPHKVGAIAIGPNEIYTLVDTREGTRSRRNLIGLCKE